MQVIHFEKRSDLLKKIDLLEIELGRLLNADNQRKARESKILLSSIEITNAKPQKYCRKCFVPMPLNAPSHFCSSHQPAINLVDPIGARGRMLTAAVIVFILVSAFGGLAWYYGV